MVEHLARTILPIPDVPRPHLTTYDAKDPDTSFPPIEPLRPPKEAPNVLVILVDDVGFFRCADCDGMFTIPHTARASYTDHSAHEET